jgi:hypothetical protein
VFLDVQLLGGLNMIEIKISDIDIFSLSKLTEELKNQEVVTYEYLPVKDKNGRVLATDSQMGDIAIKVIGFLGDQSVGLSIGFLVNWLHEQLLNRNVGIFFTIGSRTVGNQIVSKEEIRKIVKEELEKATIENGKK